MVDRGTRCPLVFPRKKIAYKHKMQKHNISKIYKTEPRLKEMTCLMVIAEQKRLLAPSNSSINITGITTQES